MNKKDKIEQIRNMSRTTEKKLTVKEITFLLNKKIDVEGFLLSNNCLVIRSGEPGEEILMGIAEKLDRSVIRLCRKVVSGSRLNEIILPQRTIPGPVKNMPARKEIIKKEIIADNVDTNQRCKEETKEPEPELKKVYSMSGPGIYDDIDDDD